MKSQNDTFIDKYPTTLRFLVPCCTSHHETTPKFLINPTISFSKIYIERSPPPEKLSKQLFLSICYLSDQRIPAMQQQYQGYYVQCPGLCCGAATNVYITFRLQFQYDWPFLALYRDLSFYKYATKYLSGVYAREIERSNSE